MLQSYRRAIAGALIALLAAGAAQAGVEVPEGVGEALLTLIVFALGYLPPPRDDGNS